MTIERPRVRARFVDQGEVATSRGGAVGRSNAAAFGFAQGVGGGVAGGGVNGIGQRRRNDGGAAAKEG